MPLPPAIQNAPVLLPGLDFYLDAFWKLSTCRSLGMGEGPIPWTAINEYAIRFSVRSDEYDYFEEIIRRMDLAYLEHRNSEYDKKNPKKSLNGNK